MVEAVLGILSTAVFSTVAWAFNINSEVKVQKKANEDLKELINTKFDAVKELGEAIRDNIDSKFASSDQRLDRIERSMNGHLLKS